MSSTKTSLAHHAATATVFAGLLSAIGRDPCGWRWPDSTAQYLQHRIEALAAELLLTGAAGVEAAA